MKKRFGMLSQKLKELRLNKKLSQVALSEKLGISNGLYNKYEKKDIRPPYETLQKLAEIYGVSIDYILGNDVAPNTPTPAPTDNTITEERLRVLGIDTDKLENLTDEQLSVIRTTLSALLDSFKKSNK
nr:MAG TPA: Repressor protein CI [Caudoviricetes sp.]